jgi:AmmeMemoRadiSam system protein B
MFRKKFLVVLVVGVAAGVLGGMFYFRSSSSVSRNTSVQGSHPLLVKTGSAGPIPLSPATDRLLDEVMASKMDWHVDPDSRVFILSHHAVAAREMASLISSIPQQPSVVYLIAPDHFNRGRTSFTTSDGYYMTSHGVVPPHEELVGYLTEQIPSMRKDVEVITKEHGVTELYPFFAHVWPATPVVPIAVNQKATEADQKLLATVLREKLKDDPKALVMGSIDFSHYLPAEVADFHDVYAEDVIRSLEYWNAPEVEIDSPGTLSIVLLLARELGLGRADIHANTNSLRILQAKFTHESTSHFLVSFAPGNVQSSRATTFLLMGDMMFDRNVARRSTLAKSIFYPFEKIRGQEDRFFWGQDLVIGNLEGALSTKRRPPEKSIDFWFEPAIKDVLKSMGFDAVSLANNHALDQGHDGIWEARKLLYAAGIMPFGDQVLDDPASSLWIIERRGKRVALLGFNTTDNPLDRAAAEESFAKAKQEKVDYIVVFTHWGPEYQSKPAKAEVDLAHWLIDQGADAVIGGHPHWMQSVEYYKGKPIAYSLGNFIFDQDWSEETGLGLVVGLVLREDGSELHLFPTKIVESQPQLLVGDERQKRLDYLAEISPLELAEQIRQGVIRWVK